ncbi:MAG: signal recognition particle protein, partial [Proteobacteria bacterium]|nr:signal recognition particle protein [Pseudomonadota bacterium]MBU1742168.1 signal recognition particle protein [Pseudomonadota bacterium]
MFEGLSERLGDVFKRLRGRGRLSEADVDAALREVRLALLEADVHYKVARSFIDSVRSRAVGREVLASLTPAQQVIKVVHEELTALMGGGSRELDLSGPRPRTVMLVGLQGSGKTTTAGKLAKMLLARGRRVLLVPADVRRPAAIEQLQKLGEQVGAPVFDSRTDMAVVDICMAALARAAQDSLDTLIVDTAGRLQIDEPLMDEVAAVRDRLRPAESLLVADAMTGQEAVGVAGEFHSRLGLTGIILTKMEGDARGGAALSMLQVTGCPIKLMGVGEKLDALEVFHPDRVASRILGMGDVLSFIEKAQDAIDQEEARKLERKVLKEGFTLEDFLAQIKQIKKMGSLESILGMIPGLGQMKKGLGADQSELVKAEAIINSMT